MPPLSMLIKPASGMCNMRCKYCFYADVSEHREVKSYGMMAIDTLEVLTKKALETADGVCSFAFQGGEPTLAGLDFFNKLIEFEQKYNDKHVKILNSIQTNGYSIDEGWARFFAQNKFLVGLSIDGTKDIHDSMRLDPNGNGTYNRIRKVTELFDRYGVEYNILCVVNNFVARHPLKVYNALRKHGYIQFIPCLDGFDGRKQDYSLDPQRYGEFLKAIFDHYYHDFKSGHYVSVRIFDNYVTMLTGRPPESCGMSGECTCYFVVEGDGSTYPCDFYVLDKYRLGNVLENSFEDMQKSECALLFVNESKYISTECKSCKWSGLCRGGCRRNREPFVHGKPVQNSYCKAYKAFFEYSYSRLVEMANVVVKSNQV